MNSSFERIRLRCAGRRSALLLFLLTPLSWSLPLWAGWVAYNDHAPGTRTHANTTRYHVFANGFPSSGTLRHIETGAALPVTLSITRTASGVASASAAGNPAPGTPLDSLFGAYVDFAGTPDNSVELSGGGAVTYTFSGLEPDQRYSFHGSAVRGDSTYVTRWTVCEIVGTLGFTAAHSSTRVLTRTQVPAMATNQAAFNSGVNHTADRGDYVGWDNIVPAANGTFSVVCRQYTGAVPDGSSSGSKGYGLTGVRLEESPCPTPVPLSVVTPPRPYAVVAGSFAVLDVAVVGCPAYFQWFKDGRPLPGQVHPSFWIAATTTNDTGDYWVVVSNTVSAVISPVARLTVYPNVSVPVIPLNQVWRYDQSGFDRGTDWTRLDYDDTGWPAGRGVLAQEDHPLITPLTQTVLSLTNPQGARVVTYYFRTHFQFTNHPADVSLCFSNLVDDGALVWLNGSELFRYNLDPGPVSASTLAYDAGEGAFLVTNLLATNLVAGDNVLAVEVHQTALTSSDIVLGLALQSVPRATGPVVVGLHPQHQVVHGGDPVSFQVEVAGQPPLACQWRFNGNDLPGQTGPVLTLPNATAWREGFYSVRVENEFGFAFSRPERLTVSVPGLLPYYATTFDSGAGPEWSNTRTELTPVGGRRFLGQFGNDTVSLKLSGLPPHQVVTVSFDLLVIRSWDGNASGGIGPDQWRLQAVDGPTLLHTTFSNWRTVVQRLIQCYPDPFGTNVNPSFYGASEGGTLGYMHGGTSMDSVYWINRTFRHAESTVQLQFSGLNLQDLTDESWGLDNVRVFLADYEPLQFTWAPQADGSSVARLLGLEHRHPVVLLSSTDLDIWFPIRTNAPGELYFDVLTLLPEALTNEPLRCYRALAPAPGMSQ